MLVDKDNIFILRKKYRCLNIVYNKEKNESLIYILY